MAIGNGELMHECFPKHSRMSTARMKEEEEGKKRGVSTEISLAGTKEISPNGLLLPNQNTILIKHNFTRYGKRTMTFN